VGLVRALKHFKEKIKAKHIKIQVDNTTLFYYVKKGTGRRKDIFRLLKQPLADALKQRTLFQPVWRPREENKLANLLSRVKDKTDWRINNKTWRLPERAYGKHRVDLFANFDSHR